MNHTHTELIARELNIRGRQAENTLQLLEEGSTVPFISRYRKEATGNLDEVQIGKIEDLKQKYEEAEQRREFIIKTIAGQEKMTPELLAKLQSTWVIAELEDIYLPYKPKRKTRAVIAVEKGLEPLAKIIFGQEKNELAAIATSYINDKVPDPEDALKGARDIMAEWINEDAALRDQLRKLFAHTAPLKSKVIEGKEEEGNKYKDYFDFSERLSSIPSHRVLAIFRGESEGFLYATIAPGEEESLQLIQNHCLKKNN